jgi:hypothetical protein
MLKEVTADVRRDTGNAQRPQQLSDMSRTFYFVDAVPDAAKGAPQTAATTPPDPADPVDVATWQWADAARECEPIRLYLRRFPNGKFADLARFSELRLCKADTPAVALAPDPPKPPAPPPAVNTLEIGRRLQKELLRVGCVVNGMENDGTWGGASRNALRLFNERTNSVAETERPTPEALEAVQTHKDRVCPVSCEPGTELRGTSCVATPRRLEQRSRHAARPPERERSRSPTPPANADAGSSALRKGESWTYQGNKRCKAVDMLGLPPRIICP